MITLFRHGILGLNARNLLYIRPFNPRKVIALADDKMRTKAFLAARGVPVAKIYARIASRRELRSFTLHNLPETCVLKPNRGFGGQGIIILQGRCQGLFLEQGKRPIPERRLREHVEDILDGRFSIDGRPDSAFFEKLLIPHDCFAPCRPAGLPDIRIVVFNLVPVMAMLRIPTTESGGKANVHRGGIGLGIDLASGITTFAAQRNRIIAKLPHGRQPGGIPIPSWRELLLLASRIQELTNIGYIAVDLTIDAEQGPLLLEVNARAGLMVQIANLAPLRSRLRRIEGLRIRTPEQGVRVAQDLFGKKARREPTAGGHLPPVIGLRETLVIPGSTKRRDIPCHIAIDAERTAFSPELLAELEREGDATRENPEEKTYRVKFLIRGRKVHTIVHAGPMPTPTVQAVVGRRDLAGFLIDPTRERPAIIRTKARGNIHAIDRTLADIDRRILLLPLITPLNLNEERARLEENRSASPSFLYPPLPPECDAWERQIITLQPDDSPMGILLKKKQDDLLARMKLLRSRGENAPYTEASTFLFGTPLDPLIERARACLNNRAACDLPPHPQDLLTAAAAQERLAAALRAYDLHDWHVRLHSGLVADCAVGQKRISLRRNARFAPIQIATLIAHEIETHAFTAENATRQPFLLFRRGCAQYLATQEGLAIVNQNRLLSPHHEKRFSAPRTALAVAFALEHSFAETRQYLEEELGYSRPKALTKVLQVKRGLGNTTEPGAFTKGLVYFHGVLAVEEFIATGGDLRKLYIGKIALEDLPLIAEIPGIIEPVLMPEYLRSLPTAPSKDPAVPSSR